MKTLPVLFDGVTIQYTPSIYVESYDVEGQDKFILYVNHRLLEQDLTLSEAHRLAIKAKNRQDVED